MSTTRRLSPIRVTVAAAVALAVAAGGYAGLDRWQSAQAAETVKPWFAAYTDVTVTPTFPFEDVKSTAGRDVMLSFVVADHDEACTPTWGAAYGLQEAGDQLDLDRRIARLEQQKGAVAVSFGGLANDELATTCTDRSKLVSAYQSVVKRYDVSTVDFDIESDDLTKADAGKRRAAAVADLQEQRRAAGHPLAVWLTLPAAPGGLTTDGTRAVAQFLRAGVDLAGVNAMTMDYGASKGSSQSMYSASVETLQQVKRQLGILYTRAGTPLGDRTLWHKVGATPMIGQNDVQDEVFSLTDARKLNAWAKQQGLGRMSMWSLNRDTTCGSNYVNLSTVSNSCSGVDQDGVLFADVLGKGFGGGIVAASGDVTKAEPSSTVQPTDDPSTSPYPVWDDEASYLEGTKIVWHRNVYEAKWWTSGDLPDDAVLSAYETPWQLVGPVLAGEKPVAPLTLPKGTYAGWSGTAAYDTGDRVLFDGTPYQAKWWNTGESPEASTSDPDGSPWTRLKDAEVKEILQDVRAGKAAPEGATR
ncbi:MULTISPECIES: chitinase [unclassified Curtobacterium]|uniref:chitinase n=1 Tax=unclassified Curtobacterium TaxID=257496 RepID=UPI001C651C76|nr:MULTISPECIES: carbohydrate-binding protein [unclassified Curtobacterium]WIB16726.1 glycosyl hydrolase family 18 protein [Curtobacterium sp. MCPF17_050]